MARSQADRAAHYADSLHIDCSSTLTPATALIELLARVKGLSPQLIVMDDVRLSPAIEHRGTRVEGFWPAINYLMELHPWPELLPGTPQRRGVLRMLTELVISDAGALTSVRPLYHQPKPQADQQQLCLLDLAVASYANTLVSNLHPWVRKAETAVQEFILANKDRPE